MPWRGYVAWNSAGAAVWVLWHVLLGFFIGEAAGVTRGIAAIVVIKVVLAVGVGAAIAMRRFMRHAARAD
jgi:membrane protein DedA with SNARE-associated domain